MKVLVISHNVFCKTTNMGKTLMSYFGEFEAENLAQLYVHSEIPTTDICKLYYRMTDKEIIKSIVTRRSGRVFTEDDIVLDASSARTDTGITAKMYQGARKRSPLIYFARDLWWCLGAWKTKKLMHWVDDFSPDAVFLASGDYSFIYKIALFIAKKRNIPLVVSCMDDYYIYNKNEHLFGGKIVHKRFMKQVRKTMEYASCILPICDKMGKDYGKMFNKPCYTLHTRTAISEPLCFEKRNAISYIGNLGYDRYKQIIKLGKALKELDIDGAPRYIDVYSGEKDNGIISTLTEENGIRFHGSIPADEVLKVMGESMAVIHTESFDESIKKRVAYSVSTKIADSLASGTPIIAYGPSDIASMDYLKENNAAYCITEEDDLAAMLSSFITDRNIRDNIVSNALNLAKKNHLNSLVKDIIKDEIIAD